MKTIMHVYKETKAITYTDKALQPTIINNLQALSSVYSVLLTDTAPPTFTQKQRERPPSKDEGGRQGP